MEKKKVIWLQELILAVCFLGKKKKTEKTTNVKVAWFWKWKISDKRIREKSSAFDFVSF